jgi:hypothetical protein
MRSTVCRIGSSLSCIGAPVSNSSDCVTPISKYMNGASKLVHLLWRKMKVSASAWCVCSAGSVDWRQSSAPWIHSAGKLSVMGLLDA